VQLSLVAVALFGITLIPDILDKFGVIHIPSWLTMGSIDDARAILSAMMDAVATVLALIFSVALLVLSMVSTLFGPRLLYRYLQDWVTQTTIGLFMATFVYICLVGKCSCQRAVLDTRSQLARAPEYWVNFLICSPNRSRRPAYFSGPALFFLIIVKLFLSAIISPPSILSEAQCDLNLANRN